MAAVERCARHRPVNAHEYQALHRDLLAACQSLSSTVEETEQALYQKLESLAQPWQTSQMLAQADRVILLDLLSRCRQAEQGLLAKTARPELRWGAKLLAGVLLVLITHLVLVWNAQNTWVPLVGLLNTGWQQLWWLLKLCGEPLWVAAAALVILLSIFLVSRTAKG
jgi:hypothetical protein